MCNRDSQDTSGDFKQECTVLKAFDPPASFRVPCNRRTALVFSWSQRVKKEELAFSKEDIEYKIKSSLSPKRLRTTALNNQLRLGSIPTAINKMGTVLLWKGKLRQDRSTWGQYPRQLQLSLHLPSLEVTGSDTTAMASCVLDTAAGFAAGLERSGWGLDTLTRGWDISRPQARR